MKNQLNLQKVMFSRRNDMERATMNIKSYELTGRRLIMSVVMMITSFAFMGPVMFAYVAFTIARATTSIP